MSKRIIEIKTIISEWLVPGTKMGYTYEMRVRKAAEAIAALPVDRVEAMAVLASEVPGQVNLFFVPGRNGGAYGVCIFETHFTCWQRHGYQTTHCSTVNDDPCDRIRAVKLYLERRAKENQNAETT